MAGKFSIKQTITSRLTTGPTFSGTKGVNVLTRHGFEVNKSSASRPVSRVLYGAGLHPHVTAIPLGPSLPMASSNQPG